MFETTVQNRVLQVRREGARWLSTGWDGGFARSPAAYNITVPSGWDETDIDAYSDRRRREAGFDTSGPTLLTGVDIHHARGARSGPVEVYATVGLSNPATLSMDSGEPDEDRTHDQPPVGTVNLVVGTDRALTDGAMANLATVAAEAKTATLLSATGFTGTTSDAVVVGCDPTGTETQFTGSSTPVGAATRACVRDALLASLDARYPEDGYPESVGDAEYGTVTDGESEVFRP